MSNTTPASTSSPSTPPFDLESFVASAMADIEKRNDPHGQKDKQKSNDKPSSVSDSTDSEEEDDIEIVIEDDHPAEESDEPSESGEESTSEGDTPEAPTAPSNPADDNQKDSAQPDKTEAPKQALWKIKRQKYDLIQKHSQLEAENRKLKEALQQSMYEGTLHYAHATQAKLQEAMQAKKHAIEESDTDGQIKADLALITAQKTLEDIQAWIESETAKNPEPKPETSPQTTPVAEISPVHKEMAQDWLDEHPDLKQTDPSFNFDKAREVAGFVNHLDAHMRQNNLQHLLYTPEYFNTLNAFVREVDQAIAGHSTNDAKPSSSSPASKPASVNTSPATSVSSPVAPVKNTASTSVSSPSKKRLVLTRAEKDAADALGISYKDWIKYNPPV